MKKKIDYGTIVRTVLQILVYVNQIIALIGSTSFADSKVYQWITLIFTILVTLVTYWYNNDWSNFAIYTRKIFDMLKDGKITQEEIDDFLKKNEEKKLEINAIENEKKKKNKEINK